jgi:hypothetical protein
MKKAPRKHPVWRILCVCGLLALTGCGSLSPRLYPVSGRVTLDGEPLVLKVTKDGGRIIIDNNWGRSDYTVVFNPDPAKGNTHPWTCEGVVGPKGEYQLWTIAFKAKTYGGTAGVPVAWNKLAPLDGSMWEGHDSGSRKGAPLGWYKVTIRAAEWNVPEADLAKIRQYLKVDTTPLSIEVVANPKPTQYDIKLEQ